MTISVSVAFEQNDVARHFTSSGRLLRKNVYNFMENSDFDNNGLQYIDA